MLADTFAHFARGLVGEGNAQDFARPCEPHRDQMGKPRGERSGLASASARQHQDRSFGGQNRFLLRIVQPRRIRRYRATFWRGRGAFSITHEQVNS